ncbi:MAG: PilZ domain-containing protein [Geminicoccaceae bacterium]
MQPQVVHEAEVHRQHVRLKIPINVEIDGSSFTVDDWSMGGFGIFSEMTSRQPGERFPVRLIFPFEDFEVSLRLDCQMVYILEEGTRFGCRFLGLSKGQLALFRYLVDAYLSARSSAAATSWPLPGARTRPPCASAACPTTPMPRPRGSAAASSRSPATRCSAWLPSASLPSSSPGSRSASSPCGRRVR